MVLAVGFSWWLSAWVSLGDSCGVSYFVVFFFFFFEKLLWLLVVDLVVFLMNFGGWNGGGMVVGTMIMVVVASRCYGGFVWCDWIFSLHAMARFAWWISFLSLRSSLKTQNPCT